MWLPDRPPTPNDHTKNPRAKWAIIAKWRAWAKRIVVDAIPEEQRVPLMYAAITVKVVVPDLRARDWENAVASLKPITDGIVEAGLLVDDSSRHVVWRSVDFEHRPRVSGLLYVIQEVDRTEIPLAVDPGQATLDLGLE